MISRGSPTPIGALRRLRQDREEAGNSRPGSRGSRYHIGRGEPAARSHALSNYRMVREALLSRAPIPVDHVHAVPTLGLTPEAAATVYERTLNSFYGADRLAPERPLFDAILLGLGPDGHTASLFPGTAVLEERERWAAAVLGAKDEARITLTYSVPESSRHTAFLVAGEEKRAVLAALRRGDATLPAVRLRPVGTLRILADAAAAAWGRCGQSPVV